jgi:hypothetical protein
MQKKKTYVFTACVKKNTENHMDSIKSNQLVIVVHQQNNLFKIFYAYQMKDFFMHAKFAV